MEWIGHWNRIQILFLEEELSAPKNIFDVETVIKVFAFEIFHVETDIF